jgi:hypothetical protein
MADLSVTVSISAQAETELTSYLVTINLQRAASGLDTYADITEWAKDTLKNQVKQWRREYISGQADQVRQAFVDANNNTRSAVKTALGL